MFCWNFIYQVLLIDQLVYSRTACRLLSQRRQRANWTSGLILCCRGLNAFWPNTSLSDSQTWDHPKKAYVPKYIYPWKARITVLEGLETDRQKLAFISINLLIKYRLVSIYLFIYSFKAKCKWNFILYLHVSVTCGQIVNILLRMCLRL